nr:MAG TPA: hypothetical protein [Caudoviricetes sp.]
MLSAGQLVFLNCQQAFSRKCFSNLSNKNC